MKNFKIAILILVLILPGSLLPQTINRTGTTAAQFLKFGASARENSLGAAGSAIADDASALYWNPGAIPRIRAISLIGSQNHLFLDLTHNFWGMIYPLGKYDAVGASAMFLNSGQLEETTLQQPQGTGRYFSYESLMLALSYGRYFTNNLSLGITVKFIREGAFSLFAHGFAIDLGSLLDTGVLGMKLGITLNNLGTSMRLSGENLQVNYEWYSSDEQNIYSSAYLETGEWKLPLQFRIGLAMEAVGENGQIMKSNTHRVILASDTVDPRDGFLCANVGVEYNYRKILSLRAGFRELSLEENESNISSGYAAGIGFRHQINKLNFLLDYAYMDYKLLGANHQISVILEIF